MPRSPLWRTLIALGVVGVIAVLAIVYLQSTTPPSSPWDAPAGTRGTLTRSVTLCFGNAEGTGLVAENREIIAHEELEASMRTVVDELLRGPSAGNAVALFDPRARVRAVFIDADGSLVLDFAGMPLPATASVRACDMALRSLMRVMTRRFPSVERLSLLVDGTPLSELERRLALPLVIDPSRWLDTGEDVAS